MAELTTQLVIESVREVLDHKHDRPDGYLTLTGETQLEALNFGSLEVTELFAILEDRVGHALDPDSIGQMQTIGDVTKLKPESLEVDAPDQREAADLSTSVDLRPPTAAA